MRQKDFHIHREQIQIRSDKLGLLEVNIPSIYPCFQKNKANKLACQLVLGPSSDGGGRGGAERATGFIAPLPSC